jgi:hypothetical protein
MSTPEVELTDRSLGVMLAWIAAAEANHTSEKEKILVPLGVFRALVNEARRHRRGSR